MDASDYTFARDVLTIVGVFVAALGTWEWAAPRVQHWLHRRRLSRVLGARMPAPHPAVRRRSRDVWPQAWRP